jgi:hypothetical protein
VLIAASSGLILSIVVVSVLGVLWVISLFLLVLDSISVGAKVVWFVALTLLAPVAIPVYLWLRYRRLRGGEAVGPA